MLLIELEIVKLLQSIRNPIFDFSFYAITQLGDQMFFILISVIIYWTIHKKYAFYFVFSFMISAVINAGLKLAFRRIRPFYYEGIETLPSWETSGYSFPSGHAQSAGVLGFYGIDAAKKTSKKVFKIIAILIMIFVPLSRIYLGQHFLSDVLVGLFLSFGIAYLCLIGLNKIGDKEDYLALSLIPIMALLFIINPTHDIAVACGAFIGFSFGYFLEKRYIKYEVKSNLVIQVIKVIFGLAVLMGIRLGLGYLFPDLPIFDFVRYIIIGLWASMFAPMVFKYAQKKYYNELTIDDLYNILDIRNEVFVLEQNIRYVDTDYKDQKSRHYFYLLNGRIISYLRVIDQNVKYQEYAISRVATLKEYRGLGYAKILLDEAISDLNNQPIRISAQAYLMSYYEKFGFKKASEPYIEEGIPHIEMLLKHD